MSASAKLLLIAAAVALVAMTLVSAYLAVKFRLSIKHEAPDLYESWWSTTRWATRLRTGMIWPFMKMIYFRQYRTVLAGYPKSRAWASWLFMSNWVQLGLVLVMWFLTQQTASASALPC